MAYTPPPPPSYTSISPPTTAAPSFNQPAPIAQVPQNQPVAVKNIDKPTISRRAILIGAVGVTAAEIGIFEILHQQPPQVPISHQQPPQEPTPHQQPPRGQLFFTYRGHSYPVDAVAWSPDGKRIASGSYDTTVQVWNATDGSNIFTYNKGHSSPVLAVAWSPDSTRIASGSEDNTVQVWEAV